VPYARHIGYQKTIFVFKRQYYWIGVKKEIDNFIVGCLECQKFKVEHRHPIGLLQPLTILEWKWEVFIIDFIMKLPRTTKQRDSIMVVVDNITKNTHFIPVKPAHKEYNIVNIHL
jgi:hypothetical protein